MKFPNVSAALFRRLQDQVAMVRPPDFIVGADSPGGAYLLRWYLTPWRELQRRKREAAEAAPTIINRAVAKVVGLLPNLYLHQFLRDDDDRALHDHPSWAASLILHGSYVEHTINAGGIHRHEQYDAGHLRFLPTRHAHRVELLREIVDNGHPLVLKSDPEAPCWTLFLFGPALREWGFHCPERGWVHWRQFTRQDAPGEVGPGCGA